MLESATSLAEVLQVTGGWGVSSILGYVVYRLWVRVNEKDERIFDLLNKQNEILKYLEKIDDR